MLRASRGMAENRRLRRILTWERFLHLYVLNRGVLLTPFYNMALMCPATSEGDVDLHTRVFGEAVAELI